MRTSALRRRFYRGALAAAAAIAWGSIPCDAPAQEPQHHDDREVAAPHDEHGSSSDHQHADSDGAHDHDLAHGIGLDDEHGHARFVPDDLPEPFGFSLAGGWFDEWPHSHFSRLGTPQIHFFFVEPAYPERDLIVDFVYTRTDEGIENEVATELEWAFTRRIGVVIEVPGLILNPNDAVQETGFGDLVIAPRFLLADFDRFAMSFNLEISTPTGDEDRGLGAGETILGPSFTGWYDLGDWWTSGFRVGVETGLDSGETEMAYDLAIAKTFCGPALFGCCCRHWSNTRGHGEHGHEGEEHAGHSHNGHDDEGHHFLPGMTSLIVEVNARTLTSGEDEGRSTAELLFGVNYALTERVQLRAGYQFPLFKPSDLEERVVTGLIYHF